VSSVVIKKDITLTDRQLKESEEYFTERINKDKPIGISKFISFIIFFPRGGRQAKDSEKDLL